MIVTHIMLKNWRNFPSVDVDLHERVFLAGPNASGKSNLIDAFRFLRDIVKPAGGLQSAVSERGGLTKIRSLAARRYPDVEIEVHLSEASGDSPLWKYALGIEQEPRGKHRTLLAYERAWKQGIQLLSRPDDDDKKDDMRRTETHLEHINANEPFRPIAQFFESLSYLHLVPQLVSRPRDILHK